MIDMTPVCCEPRPATCASVLRDSWPVVSSNHTTQSGAPSRPLPGGLADNSVVNGDGQKKIG